MEAAKDKPQLFYFDHRGLCEPIRYLLRYLRIVFEDRRFPLDASGFQAWTDMKESSDLPFPNLPYYIDDKVQLSQSLAILRHIGRKHNLYGETDEERATLDMVEQVITDVQRGAWVVFNDKNFHSIKEDYKVTLPNRLGELETLMQGKKYILGERLSCIDFLLYETVEWFRLLATEVFREHPGLKELEGFQQRIESLEEIKQYVNSDKFKSWPLFGSMQYFGHSKDPEYKPTPFSYRNWVAKYPLE